MQQSMFDDHDDQPVAETLDSLFSVGQIRLAELSAYNWGSFGGLHTARVDPEGTLVTGDNGAGKSTLIDGLMALLLPAGKATFNVAAAQGDKTDRSLLSYMRGSYGSAHDGSTTRVMSKREGAVVTGLRALYHADDGSVFTLAALFWTTQPGNALADVKRVYIIAKRNLSLKALLDAFGEGNVRSLKQWLRDDPLITCCDDNFSNYQELYRKLLHMDNKNAPSLLSRALGLKKIDDLTRLIRELVLEPSSVRDDARKVVEEFTDLRGIHDRLLDAREQQQALSRLPELNATLERTAEAIRSLEFEKASLPVYFGEVLARLWAERAEALKQKLESIERDIRQQQVKADDESKRIERLHEEYLQLGGDRIESLKLQLQSTEERLERVIRESSRYQDQARELKLSPELSETNFNTNQAAASEKLQNIQADTEACQDRFAEASGQYSKLQSSLHEVVEEITVISARPDSNVDIRFQQLRDELLSSIDLEPQDCQFIGELIDVKAEERHWQGAIERALGGLRTTLAVPLDRYSMVTRWLNARHTGLHVRVQVVDNRSTPRQPPMFADDGYLRKLIWRDHPYRDWLKHHLSRFDLKCVADTETLDNTPFSMTQQGLMHKEKGRFEKKDQSRVDDRRQWNLGFSNKSRLALLNVDKTSLEAELQAAGQQVTQARQALDATATSKSLWEAIRNTRWEDINAPRWQSQQQQFKADLAILERAGGNIAQARHRWETAKEALKEIQQALNTLNASRGAQQNSLERAQREQQRAQELSARGLNEDIRQNLAKRVGTLTADDLDQMTERQHRIERAIDAALETERNRSGMASRTAVGIMSAFRSNEKWQVLAVEWQADIASIPDYLEHLAHLEKEGLPTLVEQFVERLNKHATQSLARIKTRLESEREDILERIDTINFVLLRTEFRAGTHLKLGSRKEKFPHVIAFDKSLGHVLSQINSDDHESRFTALESVIEILDKASTPGNFRTQENLRLLDPRYQMSFYAEEINTTSGEVVDVLESSSGKSGGEKESFAGTIVAASLTYVLTPDGYDKPVYCTVFLDEAFSNTAEVVSRRVLQVFRELKIHVNLITPYKNLNLARESARSLLIVERDGEKHESYLSEVTWEEIDRRLDEQRKKLVKSATEDFGVELAQ